MAIPLSKGGGRCEPGRPKALLIAGGVAAGALIAGCTSAGHPVARVAATAPVPPARIVTFAPFAARTPPAPARPASGSPGSVSGSVSRSAPGNCQDPKFVSSSLLDPWQNAGYYLTNNMWNITNYIVWQTLRACSYRNWSVTATMNNDSGDNVVKTYPNVHRDFTNAPVSRMWSATAQFAHDAPPGGIYEHAFDIWLNGVAQPWATEIMIWTDNHGQIPRGSIWGRVTFDGKAYQVWKDRATMTFVAKTNASAGTLNLLSFFRWVAGKGWMNPGAVLKQVDYGVELVSTDSVPKTFTFTNFQVNVHGPGVQATS